MIMITMPIIGCTWSGQNPNFFQKSEMGKMEIVDLVTKRDHNSFQLLLPRTADGHTNAK